MILSQTNSATLSHQISTEKIIFPALKLSDDACSCPYAQGLAELAAAGKAAVLIPLPTATDDHQRQNARVLVNAGAARVVEQASAPADAADVVVDLLTQPSRCAAMGAAMRGFAQPNAAATIVDQLWELVS